MWQREKDLVYCITWGNFWWISMSLGDVKRQLSSFDNSYSFEPDTHFLSFTLPYILLFRAKLFALLWFVWYIFLNDNALSHFEPVKPPRNPAQHRDLHHSAPDSAASLLPLQLPAGPELNFWFMGFHHFSETADSALSRGMASHAGGCPYNANMGLLSWPSWAKKLNYFPCLLLLVFNVFCKSKWKWTWTESHCGQRTDSCWLQWMFEGGPETYSSSGYSPSPALHLVLSHLLQARI